MEMDIGGRAMTKLQSLLTELKRLELEAKETGAWNTLSAYSDLVQNASPVLIECLEIAQKYLKDIKSGIDYVDIDNQAFAAEALAKLDALCERGK